MNHLSRVVKLSTAILACFVLASCAVGPDYHEPELNTPDAWTAAIVEDVSEDAPTIERWWESWNDPQLTELIQRSELANLNLRLAAARVDEARAIRGIATGDRLPTVDLIGAYRRTQLSDNGSVGSALPEGTSLAPASLYNGTLDASWEIDLFGRVRRQVESATASLDASVEDYRDVLVTLFAEVAFAYVDVRTFQSRIAAAQSNAAAQDSSVQLTRARFEAGLTSALDVAQAERNLASTESIIPPLETGLEVSLNRLARLLGLMPGALHAEFAQYATLPRPDDALTLGLPADLLRRRPDVRAAERNLAAQTARIGVATSALYPRFSIGGFLGLESTDSGEFFGGSSVTWGIVPGFSWSLFSGGKLRNQVRVEEARTEQATAIYEDTVLSALEEANNALMSVDRERARQTHLLAAVNAAQRAVTLVHTQYISGLTNFQNYLDAQRALLEQQDQLVSSEGQVLKNLVGLNKALGGGWSVTADAANAQDNE